MRASSVFAAGALFLGALLLSTPAVSQNGQISGTVTNTRGAALPGVAVSVDGTEATALTDATGDYHVRVAPGVYTVTFSAGDDSEQATSVTVAGHETTRLDRELDWTLPFAATTVVQAPSLRAERLLEAASTTTVVNAETIESRAAQGRIPPTVFGALGAETTESGLTDYTINTRGQNDLLNPRVGVRVDGRETSMLFLGGQEWAALTMPLASVAQVELVQGPASSIYGGDGANGVLSVVTGAAQVGRGLVRLGGGEASSVQGDVIWSPGIGKGSHLDLQGSYRDGELFSVSRNVTGEYAPLCAFSGQADCLPGEAVPLAEDSEDTAAGSVGFEHAFGKGFLLTLDGGAADLSGSVLLSDLGRLQVLDSLWTWGKGGITTRHWDVGMSYRDRDASEQLALATGDSQVLEERAWNFDVRTEWTRWQGFDLMVGLSHDDEDVSTAIAAGDPVNDEANFRPQSVFSPAQRDGTLFWLGFGELQQDSDAAFAQVDWQATDRFRLVVGTGFDDGSNFEPQWTPKLGLVFEISERSSVRFGYSQGFREPTLEELFLQFDASALGFNLAGFEPDCRLHSVTCGFDLDNTITEASAPTDSVADTRFLVVGNDSLDVEQTETLELGYRGQLGDLGFVTLNAHQTDHDDLIAGPLPQFGTSLGVLNPAFQPYQLPEDVLSEAQMDQLCNEGSPEFCNGALPSREDIRAELIATLGGLFPLLSTNPIDGTPVLVVGSYTNLGSTQTTGVDAGVDLRFGRGFRVDFNYSWLDTDIDAPAGLDEFLLPNAPENRAGFGLGYTGVRWGAQVRGRWLDDYRWVSPPFRGDVESFTTFDVFAHFEITEHVELGLAVANASDEEQFQVFGGDQLERRAIGSVTLSW